MFNDEDTLSRTSITRSINTSFFVTSLSHKEICLSKATHCSVNLRLQIQHGRRYLEEGTNVSPINLMEASALCISSLCLDQRQIFLVLPARTNYCMPCYSPRHLICDVDQRDMIYRAELLCESLSDVESWSASTNVPRYKPLTLKDASQRFFR